MEESESLRETISRIYQWQQHTPPLMVFTDAIIDIEKLSGAVEDDVYINKHLQLLYANVITAIESYLLDTFVLTVLKKRSFRIALLSEAKEFCEEKYTLKEIYDERFDIDQIIKERLFDISWHNIAKAKALYRVTFKISFPDDIEGLYKAVSLRHDIVHRNGKNKDGQEIIITKVDLENLVELSQSFVMAINSQILKVVQNGKHDT